YRMCRGGGWPGRLGGQLGELMAAIVEIGEVRQVVEGAGVELVRAVSRRRGSRLEVADGDRAGRRLQPFEEAAGGLELGIHAQHEVAAQERLLAAALLGQVQGLLEGAENSLLRVRGEGRIAGVSHLDG